MTIEGLTAATDYVLGAAAFAGALGLLRRASRGRHLSIRLWAAGFAAVGAAAVLGGAWHTRSPRFVSSAPDVLWKATLVAAGLAGFLLIAGAAFASVSRRAARWIAGAAAVKLVVFAGWAITSDAFDPVILDSVVNLAALVTLQSLALARRRARSAPWVLAGAAVSAAGAAIEAFRPALPPPFGPDAVYHVVQLAGLILFYRGGLLFPDR